MPVKDDLKYSDLNSELEIIIDSLQSNSSDIEKALKDYERGVELITKLEKYLNEAENKVKKVNLRSAKASS